jgi:haloacetate dehalogenase
LLCAVDAKRVVDVASAAACPADKLGIADFFLCGHDRGGRVAHRLALDHPQRVRKLCVLDIAPTLDMHEATGPDFAQVRVYRCACEDSSS